MKQPTDFRGKPLIVGDKVGVITGYTGGRRYLKEQIVLGFTPQRIVVGENLMQKYGRNIQADKIVKLDL